MRSRRITSRRGTVLIAVLVCMGVAMTIVLAAVQTSIRQRRQTSQEFQIVQTRWLMDAGVSKAISRLQTDPDYEGESLVIGPVLERYPNANIKIMVIRKEQGDRIRVRVIARLAGSGELAPTMRRSIEFDVDVRKKSGQRPGESKQQ